MTMTNEKEKQIKIPPSITVRELARVLNINASALILELIKNGVMATINQEIDFETASIVAQNLGFNLVLEEKELGAKEEALEAKRPRIEKKLVRRPPVVVVLGHVDHGKTTLLDTIRVTKVAATEVGGITQRIGAYQAVVRREEKGKTKEDFITFLDTPGHEAFSKIRERGASVTDIAVLVVAADDGVQPQTKEAIGYCNKYGVPIVVAINKIDKPGANVEKLKKQLAEIGLIPEEWGGKTIMVEISAKAKIGIDKLLEMILLVAEIEDLKADSNLSAWGTIIESRIDPQKGMLATVLVGDGTLREGDNVVADGVWGKVRFLENFLGQRVKKAEASTPVILSGFNDLPPVGEHLQVVSSSSKAKTKAEEAKAQKAREVKKVIVSEKKKEVGRILNIIIKADFEGSLQALRQILDSIKIPKVQLNILRSEIGLVNESDVKLARVSGAIIYAFNVKTSPVVTKLVSQTKVRIKTFAIIYHLIEDIKKELNKLLEPEIVKVHTGTLEVIAVFKTGGQLANKTRQSIFGARVGSGVIKGKAVLEIIRDNVKIDEGEVLELQFNKKDVSEVKAGENAGINYRGKAKIKIGDKVEAYIKEIREQKIA